MISGHDLRDLELLLEQTAGKGVNVYTHGEMLPAHGYPALKKYPHLKGNFGTAWQNQQREFADLPAPVLFTTNCLMPPKTSYADRVFTTSAVSYPGIVHIDPDKDFTPVIEKALALGGYPAERAFTGINGGRTVTTGFARGAVLGTAEQVIGAVRSGAIRHFFLVAGCDGARPGRNYYTEFVEADPARHRRADPRLREIPLQRPRPRHGRRSAAPDGHRAVQRRLLRHSNRPRAG